jgi:signal transduction histidine kinase
MTLWHVALLAVVLAAVGTFLVLRLRSDLTGAIDAQLRPAADQVARDYRLEGVPEFADSGATVLHAERAAGQLLDAGGVILTTFGDPVSDRPMLSATQLDRVLRGATAATTRHLDGAAFRVVARRVTRRGAREAVVLAEAMRPVDASVRRVVVLLLLAVPAALAAVALGGWWLARRALRPVDRITETAAAIGANRLDARVPVPAARDEVARLATTLNTMLERLEAAVGEQRRLVADASHELRTPLAAMRAEIDVSLRADALSPAARLVLESAREEVARLSRTVDDLLLLAAADDGAPLRAAEPVRLESVAEDVVAALAAWAAGQEVGLAVEGPGASVLADPVAVERAVRNLAENAVRFSPAGAVVVLRVAADDRTGRLEVDDDGPGVPEAMRERIFGRFVREDAARGRATGGSGLGLAIAREVARAHGGDVTLRPREPRGSRFVLTLPLSRAGAPARPGARPATAGTGAAGDR